MKHFFLLLIISSVAGYSQNSDKQFDKDELIRQDSLFWVAFNRCDVDEMMTFFTDDMEFYHDNGGFTKGLRKFEEETRAGMCKDPANWSLRRVEIKESTEIYEINQYGAIISGEHLFYINETDKDEYLDGYGKYQNIWKYDDGEWKMSRILSYDHKAPPEKYKAE
ncbi:nuclear transport factor 2 family protein [Mangrovivirga sp. M17]|uniref:Nuclear transport factor 2 family protein n=1 Tax=Mangrovivirga halotolerans TaxID=2993936 RepID=A0ABT3RM58_9BACT|nr:nuclear transport factor 2 family protein [Mangrovivirga halotolerans]MCX2742804.1 nuclear transport factor 2 family protein [Mangrovivirga halotolerans]